MHIFLHIPPLFICLQLQIDNFIINDGSEQFIIDFVNEVVPFSLQVVKDLNSPQEEEKPKATKTASKTTKAKKEVVPVEEHEDDLMGDAPF